MISFEHVSKVYSNKKAALEDINLEIKPREFVCVVGHSGAGKSTIIRLINMEEKPTEGKINVGGIDYSKFPKRNIPFLRRKIGIVYQDFKLLPKQSVFENVAYALEVAGVSNKEIRERVPKILQLVGLSKNSKCLPEELSGGERQRVAIARALVHQPKILIADEPTGNLDPKNAWEIIDLLLKINSFGTTVLLTTHNKEIVDSLKKRVITISKGKIVKDQKVGKYTI
uniref:Cell division ATP-binding protein FtsE n=1 Tax=candidate division WWE3 bacterium TaxID=2053526 RepID=A0A7C4XHG6_UNCKA